MTRASVESRIRDDEAFVRSVVELVERRVVIAEWPAAQRAALALALDDPEMPLAEQWKATTLRRHLFGGKSPPRLAISSPSSTDRDHASCLRASLAALVRFRAASYLV